MEIASESEIDIKALITHVINGLPGSQSTKNYMYEAENIKQLKKKLESFENIQLISTDIIKSESKNNE